jgi:hypothetical protein
MPRYYFHLHNSEELRDDEGADLPTIAAAREQAIRAGRGIICGLINEGKEVHRTHRIEVEDEQGRKVLTIAFGELIELV